MENKNILYAIMSGFLFGFWPILMKRSGLNGYWQGATFAFLVTVLMLTPAIVSGFESWKNLDWKFALLSGIAGGLGMFIFTKITGNCTDQEFGSLFSIVLLIQVAMAGGYHVLMNGAPNLKKTIGFILTGVVVYLMK